MFSLIPKGAPFFGVLTRFMTPGTVIFEEEVSIEKKKEVPTRLACGIFFSIGD